ncbi:MAG TPA: hypothetical protein VNJ01_10725 [Bacteriovoracaceae bacterium]|nr:hypothetical protein [Bacteriovoracaceae bacterium]
MKVLGCIGIILLYSIQAGALETRKEDGRVILVDKTCDFEKKITTALMAWSRKPIPSRTCEVKKVSSPDHANCELDIHDCLPKNEADLLGSTPKHGAPNCHNFALLSKGLVSAQYNTKAQEILGYLNDSPLCRKLSNDEPREAGDVGFLTGPTIFEMHSFIYLSDDFYLSKNGAGFSPYGIFDSETVLSGYNVPPIQKCRKNSSPAEPDCPMRTSYYRCLSMDEYLQGKMLSKPYRDAILALEEYEKVVGCRAMSGELIDKTPAKDLATDTLKVLARYLKNQTAKVVAQDSKDEDEIFLLGSLGLRLESIRENNMFYDLGGFIGGGSERFESFFTEKAFRLKHKNSLMQSF